MFAIVVVIYAIVVTQANSLTLRGKCPDIKPDSDFDIEKWANGTWYYIYQDADHLLKVYSNVKCTEKEFIYDPVSEKLVVESYSISATQNAPVWHTSFGDVTETPGKFIFNVPGSRELIRNIDKIDFRTVDTDFTTYTYGYACAKDLIENKSYITIGIASRSRVIPQGVVKDALKFFKSYGLNLTLTKVDWRDCRARCHLDKR